MNQNLFQLLDEPVNDVKMCENFVQQEIWHDTKGRKISDNDLLNIAGGFGFTKSQNKITASLIGSILITMGMAQGSARVLESKGTAQTGVSIIQKSEDGSNIDFKEKIKSNASKTTKQTLETLSKTVKKCADVALDTITPLAHAEELVTKTKPSVSNWPTAANVTVGQTVGSSKLSGGSASVAGSFSWLTTVVDEELITIGQVTYICQFTPNDTVKYTKVTQKISFRVLQGDTKITSYPVASDIKYGQKLSDSTFSGGSASVPGKFSWVDSSIAPSTGKSSYAVKFVPYDSNYKSTTINVKINVSKAIPQVSSWPTASKITDGDSLANSHFTRGKSNVDGDFSWVDSTVKPKIGRHEYTVKFTPTDSRNYEDVYKKVSIEVEKVDVRINWPSASDIKYGQKLSDSTFSGGSSNIKGIFEWNRYDADSKPTAGTKSYKVVFKPYDSDNYSQSDKYINVKIDKANPKITSSPYASDIYYGQKLSDSHINGGKADTDGSFSWRDGYKSFSTGTHIEEVIFTPSNTSNYNNISIDLSVKVKKALVTIKSYPSVSSITYGQSLASSQISDLNANVYGSANWVNPAEIPEAGTYVRNIVFTPYDSSNYEAVSTVAQVVVNKATPKLQNNKFESPYNPGMILNDFSLPKYWRWQTPNALLDHIGKYGFVAVHDGNSNYHQNNETVTININKAEPKLPLVVITYNETSPLKNIQLPAGWRWLDENEVPVTSKSTYKASFDSREAGTNFYYDRNEVNLRINVNKSDPGIKEWPKPKTNLTYGDNLSDIQLEGGKTKVPGRFQLLGNATVLKIGEHQCKVVFTPDNPNYETKTGTLSIRVQKNMNPAESPGKITTSNVIREDNSIKFVMQRNTEGIEFSKDGGNTWQDSSEFESLSPKTEYNFVHRYKDTESRCEGKISPDLKISTKESAPSAPKELRVKTKTNHEIIFESNSQLEFSRDDGKTWQDSSEFKNLSSSKIYNFVARVKAMDNHVAGVRSDTFIIKTRSWFGNFWNIIFG